MGSEQNDCRDYSPDDETLLQNLALLRRCLFIATPWELSLLRFNFRGGTETIEHLVATVQEKDVEIQTLQMRFRNSQLLRLVTEKSLRTNFRLNHSVLQTQAMQGRERQLQAENSRLEYSLAMSEQDKLILEVLFSLLSAQAI